jgi:hypothetical protein
MKKLALFGVIMLGLFACDSTETEFNGPCIQVKILRSICGTAVFKIQNPAYYHVGESVGGEENVFLGTLECSFYRNNETTIPEDSEDQVFYAELDPEDFNADCARCYALVDYTGSKNYRVRLHATCQDSSGGSSD